jgi:hypothetical protein
LAGSSTADDYIAQMAAGLTSKKSDKRRDRRETGHPAKIPADAKFRQPILTRKKASAHSAIPAAAYDWTAGRQPLPMPAPRKPSATVPAAAVHAAAIPAGAEPAAQFSEADNLHAL